MRLIVNAHDLSVPQSGGFGLYAQQLIGRLGRRQGLAAATPDPVILTTAHRPRRLSRIARWAIPMPIMETIHRAVRAPRSGKAPGDLVAGLAGVQPRSAEPDWATGEDLILHELSAVLVNPLMAGAATRPGTRLAVTVHDLQDLDHPEHFSAAAIGQRRVNYAHYAARADLVFAISQFTRDSIIRHWRIPADRIVVTPLAAAAPAEQPEAQQWAAGLGRFIVYPAKPWPHKNHVRLFEAVRRQREALRKAGLKLLLTGGFSATERGFLESAIARAGIAGLVELVGFVDTARLGALFRHAELMIFPSLFEGFGMPVVEAQLAGCPVACADNSALPEVAGLGARFFDAGSVDAIEGVLSDLLADRIDRAGLRAAGYRNVARYSWEATYAATVGGYRALGLG